MCVLLFSFFSLSLVCFLSLCQPSSIPIHLSCPFLFLPSSLSLPLQQDWLVGSFLFSSLTREAVDMMGGEEPQKMKIGEMKRRVIELAHKQAKSIRVPIVFEEALQAIQTLFPPPSSSSPSPSSSSPSPSRVSSPPTQSNGVVRVGFEEFKEKMFEILPSLERREDQLKSILRVFDALGYVVWRQDYSDHVFTHPQWLVNVVAAIAMVRHYHNYQEGMKEKEKETKSKHEADMSREFPEEELRKRLGDQVGKLTKVDPKMLVSPLVKREGLQVLYARLAQDLNLKGEKDKEEEEEGKK